MNRSDRILLEQHVNQLDEMQRSIMNMRSVLVRRMRRLEREPRPPVRRLIQAPAPPLQDLETGNPLLEAHVPRARVPREPRAPPVVIDKIIKKSKTVKTFETDSILPDACGVCLENHKKIDSLTCNCTHQFGKECFNKWKNICHKLKKNTPCPICRTTVNSITLFRARKIRVAKPTVDSPVVIIE